MMLKSQYRRLGVLVNDDRASGGQLTEADVTTCAHCQAIVRRDKWRFHGGWCGQCCAPVCFLCGERTKSEGCMPFLRLVDAALDRQYRRQQNARILGI